MTIKPLNIVYVTSSDVTSFYYLDGRNKEQHISIKGKYKGSRIEYDVIKFIDAHIKRKSWGEQIDRSTYV